MSAFSRLKVDWMWLRRAGRFRLKGAVFYVVMLLVILFVTKQEVSRSFWTIVVALGVVF